MRVGEKKLLVISFVRAKAENSLKNCFRFRRIVQPDEMTLRSVEYKTGKKEFRHEINRQKARSWQELIKAMRPRV